MFLRVFVFKINIPGVSLKQLASGNVIGYLIKEESYMLCLGYINY